jgi:predicted transcriptional regulator of viral defense system
VAEHFSWASPNAAQDVFKALEKQGHIERNDNGKYRFKTTTRPEIAERGIWS